MQLCKFLGARSSVGIGFEQAAQLSSGSRIMIGLSVYKCRPYELYFSVFDETVVLSTVIALMSSEAAELT